MTALINPAYTMTGNGMEQTRDRLVLRSGLADVQQLSPWIEELTRRYAISASIQYSMILCLEEAISNIIQYGYAGTDSGSIVVSFRTPGGYFEFLVDDEAPRFNPLDAPELPPLNPHEEMRIGGHGIRLLRQFADEIQYEATPNGNRLRIRFLATATATGIINTGKELEG
jgi:serine/threonine-protein kinase RsbW